MSQIGFFEFVELTEKWLENYPESVFTGESGDPGPVFIAAVREAVENLSENT